MIIRKANQSKADCDIVFNLSNDPVVRTNSFSQENIEYTDHCNWYAKTLKDKNILFLLVFVDETERDFVGQIRFKRATELSSDCIISLSITELFRGKHIANEFIELAIEELKKTWDCVNTVIAEVKDENIASNKLFLKEKFELVSRINTYKKVIK